MFDNFLDKHGKKYENGHEYYRRFLIFKANLRKIDYLQRTEQGSAKYGVTEMADLTGEYILQRLSNLMSNWPKPCRIIESIWTTECQNENINCTV